MDVHCQPTGLVMLGTGEVAELAPVPVRIGAAALSAILRVLVWLALLVLVGDWVASGGEVTTNSLAEWGTLNIAAAGVLAIDAVWLRVSGRSARRLEITFVSLCVGAGALAVVAQDRLSSGMSLMLLTIALFGGIWCGCRDSHTQMLVVQFVAALFRVVLVCAAAIYASQALMEPLSMLGGFNTFDPDLVQGVVASCLAAGVLIGGCCIARAARTGQTATQKVMKMKVVAQESGAPPGFGRSLLRAVVLAIVLARSPLSLLVAMGSDATRRGHHDHAAGTVVIRTRRRAEFASTCSDPQAIEPPAA